MRVRSSLRRAAKFIAAAFLTTAMPLHEVPVMAAEPLSQVQRADLRDRLAKLDTQIYDPNARFSAGGPSPLSPRY